MTVHGSLDYAGDSINLNTTDGINNVALRLIADGASPHYTFTHESSSLLKKTGLNHYRATTFENWKNDAAELYAIVNEALAGVAGQAMVRHENIQSGVTASYYANGVVITVNQSGADVTVNGENIAAGSYVKGVWE
jgi:hypothetical protein